MHNVGTNHQKGDVSVSSSDFCVCDLRTMLTDNSGVRPKH